MKRTHHLPVNKKILFRVITVVAILLILIGGFFLLRSIVTTGYNYVFDNDELYHSQVTYLIANGYKPFTNIYLTVYPPIFHAVLLPIYTATKFTFTSLYSARVFMIALFFLRTLLGAFILGSIFGTPAGLLFIPFYLLSPFAVFVEMQIRPDNLMITFFLLAISANIIAVKRNMPFFWILSGAFAMLSTLTLLKILPSIAVFFFFLTLFLLWKKKFQNLLLLYFGAGIVFTIFCVYFLIQGSFMEMIRQVLLESVSSYTGVFEFPVPLGFFYHPRNTGLYGMGGKPLSWYFTWILPPLAFAGIYHTIQSILEAIKNKNREERDFFLPQKLVLIFSLLTQWAFLFFLESVFIQHYIPINWLFAGFAAITVTSLIRLLKPVPILRYTFLITVLVGIYMVGKESILANGYRAEQTSVYVIESWEQAWKMVPKNAPVFPNLLFRPLAYPVPYGHFIGNIPDSIYYRLPYIPAVLEQNKIKYVYLDSYYLSKLKPDVQEYIRTHYVQSKEDLALYTRIP